MNICNKTRRLVGILYRQFYKYSSPDTMLRMYSFIRPHLEHAMASWDSFLKKDIELLKNVQKFALRVCTKQWDVNYSTLLETSGMLSLESRRVNAKLCHLYKIVNGNTFHVCSTGKTVYVRGYTRSNGTHVAGYFRSPPSSKGSSTKTSSAGNPHNRCSPSISSVAANCSRSPASPPHWSSSAKTVYNIKSMASATHTMANHVRLPPRITVTSVSLSSSSQSGHSRDPSNVQVSSTRSQCIKSMIYQVDTDKTCCHSVQKCRPEITVPTKPDLPVVEAHTDISK